MNFDKIISYQPQLAAKEHGAEPNLRAIVHQYYRTSGMTYEEATKCTADYFNELLFFIMKNEG